MNSTETNLVVAGKSIEVKRDKAGNIIEGVDYFVNFQPNFYKVPIRKEVHDHIEVGQRYWIDLRKFDGDEAKND